jgi:hypothetical protein
MFEEHATADQEDEHLPEQIPALDHHEHTTEPIVENEANWSAQ